LFLNNNKIYYSIKEFTLDVTNNGEHVVDLLVENLGRINVGSHPSFVQQKGIAEVHQSKIELNDQEIQNVTIIAAEFKGAWVKR
jgi:methenyltetrahydromethanopterin cyclohydrolase